MSSTLAISQETTTNADDVPDPQATDKHPQVTDEQLVINATEELSQHSSPSTEQQLQSRVKELEKELEAIQKDRARDEEHATLFSMKSNFLLKRVSCQMMTKR